jgi:hypothetical protein
MTTMSLPNKNIESVGTRISWGAIAAGAVVALGVYFLLGILGAAVGLTVGERVNPANLQHWAIAWTIGIVAVALFVGGLVTSQFTVGADRIESILYGIIMWALIFTVLLTLGAVGVRSNFQRIVNQTAARHPGLNWEQAAREAGVTAEQIDAWRQKLQAPDQKTAMEIAAAITHVTWYAFAGVWLSMMAAAAGAFCGAHPTLRGTHGTL